MRFLMDIKIQKKLKRIDNNYETQIDMLLVHLYSCHKILSNSFKW